MLNCKKIIGVALISVLLSSCAQNGSIRRQDVTTAMGAIGGGILGSNVGKGKGRMLGAAVGALAGAATGSWLGANLDNPQDRMYYSNNTQSTLETVPIGQAVEWSNPESGSSGYTVPVKTFKREGRYCREYTQVIVVSKKKHKAYGTACRQPDGTWEIIK